MTTSTAKKLGLTAARKWFIATEVPHIDDAVRMMAPSSGDSPSWHDIMDVSSMAVNEGVLHIDAKIMITPTPEWININTVVLPSFAS